MKNSLFLIVLFAIVSCKKTKDTTTNYEPTPNPCEDMGSYNQGVSDGRGQRGILTDCDTYYPYEGWADNKDCCCKGFNEGKK